MSHELGEVKSIGVWGPGPIGDLVMATPALRALRQAVPDARLVLYAPPPAVALMEGVAGVDTVHARSRNVREMLAVLRREEHDLLLLLTGSFRSGWIAWRAGVRRRVGFGGGLRSFLLSDPIPRTRGRHRQDPAPMVESYLELVRGIGLPAPSAAPVELTVTAADESAADELLAPLARALGHAPRTLLAVSPGAAYGSAKCWPVERFAAVLQSLLADPQLDAACVILFAPSERELAQTLRDALIAAELGDRVLCERVPLAPTRAVLARTQLHLTNDTGARHIGHATGTPTLAFLGPTQSEWSTYPGQRLELLQIDVPCGPCMRRQCPLGHHRCMVDITTDAALAAARRLLSGAQGA